MEAAMAAARTELAAACQLARQQAQQLGCEGREVDRLRRCLPEAQREYIL
jgi:hypothetical protein